MLTVLNYAKEECIFCKIIEKKIEAKIVFESDEIVAFNDIKPLAPVHVVIIPKKHLASVNEIVSPDDVQLLGNMLVAARDIAIKLGIAKNGYKLLFRVGKHGGQEVDHLHLHLIGGAALHEEIGPLAVEWK
ncbi:MAG: histidine triad nucleotide-binding protein [Candidatus Moranbacteria bacterium]|nr:histidine triad nucleotide-binding protein [Candidatus Moranbacteria bacterium]